MYKNLHFSHVALKNIAKNQHKLLMKIRNSDLLIF